MNMASNKITENLNIMMKKVMEKLGETKYEIKIDSESGIGENYVGRVIFLRGISKENEQVYHFVLKIAKSSEVLRNTLPIEILYKRELFMYSEVFPYFRKFIKEVNSEFDFDFVPKDYWLESTPFQEALILENMKMKGYKLHNRQKPWNLKHSLKAMTTYGKFHALSFAIKDQKPEVFKHLTKCVQNSEKYINFEYLNQSFGSHLRNVLKLLKSANRNDLAIKFEEKFESIIYTPLEENDKFVIGHGDCWNNNFVFKYRNGDETSPSKVILLDFQMSTWETPVYDLAFIIYMTSDKSSLERLDLLLETYYESLSKSLRILGSNPDEIFTFEQLKQHWKKYSAFGLRFSSKLLKMELMNDGDVPDLEKMVEENVPFEDWFNIKSEALEEYNRRILNVFIHYGENFL